MKFIAHYKRMMMYFVGISIIALGPSLAIEYIGRMLGAGFETNMIITAVCLFLFITGLSIIFYQIDKSKTK